MSGLNHEQKKAVETIDGPLLVLAGAGSGKTRVVTYRIINLIELGVPPSQILGLTFTNKAANEMKERIQKLTSHQVLISTFHSLGARILRESIHHLNYTRDFTIYDEEDSEKLLKTCFAELNTQDKKLDTKLFRNLISKAKNSLIKPENIDLKEYETYPESLFPQMYSLYQSKLHLYNAVDFDDLLYLPARLLQEHPNVLEQYQNRWLYLLIDEYQDTNPAQYHIVKKLVERSKNLCVVGDPDQSIYSWRGANIKNILHFEKDYPGAEVIRLEQNYRSRDTILKASNALIGYNDNRFEKNLWSEKGAGGKIRLFIAENERAEAEFVAEQIWTYHKHNHVPLREIVVFYRTNAQSRVFEDFLLSRKIPYTIVGGLSFYHRKEIKDILSFLRMVISDNDFISFSRTINIPKRGIGETSIEKIRLSAAQEGVSLFVYCEAIVNNSPLNHPLKLTAKQRQSLQEYLQVIGTLRKLHTTVSLKDLVISAIENSRYLDHLHEDKETFDDRKGNLDALISKAMEWELMNEASNLESFLEELSLKSTLDETHHQEDKLNLMTIHNGKGLEFEVTFIVGLEEDLFPHVNSRSSKEALEEERRLCYVGMTRAKESLYLTHSRFRFLWGTTREQRPSRFLREIPLEYIERIRQPVEFTKTSTEKPFPSKKLEFSKGDPVFHTEFGIGEIREIQESSIGTIYKIFFNKENSIKSIVSHFANLTKL